MTKEKIDLIILPTLNYHEKLQTDNILSLLSIEHLLNNLIKTYYINSITIDGGEISTLSDFYFDFLFKLLKLYTKQIKVYTDFLFVNKSLLNNTDILQADISISIMSPSRNMPIVPPSAASGHTCPMAAPRVAPENLPSVISATVSPSPAPTMAEVGVSISRIPGPPLGPS